MPPESTAKAIKQELLLKVVPALNRAHANGESWKDIARQLRISATTLFHVRKQCLDKISIPLLKEISQWADSRSLAYDPKLSKLTRMWPNGVRPEDYALFLDIANRLEGTHGDVTANVAATA